MFSAYDDSALAFTATEVCDSPYGYILDDAYILSSDPEDDIVLDVWWINDAPCWYACMVPPGSHTGALEARDARGAAQVTAKQAIEIELGSRCGS